MTGKVMVMYGSDVWEQCSVEIGCHHVNHMQISDTCCIKRIMYMSSGEEHYASETAYRSQCAPFMKERAVLAPDSCAYVRSVSVTVKWVDLRMTKTSGIRRWVI